VWDLTTLSRGYLSRIEFSSTGANHRRRIVATSRKMSRICARVWSNPGELSTTKFCAAALFGIPDILNKPLTRVRATEHPFAAKPTREKKQ
jgi:hypothetical protein